MVLIRNLSSDAATNVGQRPTLERIAFEGNIGRARMRELYDMFYKHGPGNGTFLGLPFDQLVEHGIGHMLYWERAGDPRAVIELANRGIFSALALSIGQAEKYQNDIGDIPLIVKLDGHFLVGEDVPYDRHATMSSVERALRVGANGLGLTFYFGGLETKADVERIAPIIELVHDERKIVFGWAYTRGSKESLPGKMGDDSLYWCAQAISALESMGVDVAKQKYPMPAKNKAIYEEALKKGGYFHSKMPEIHQLLLLEPEDPNNVPYELHVRRLAFMARVAPNTFKIISGGPIKDDETELYNHLKIVMDSGNEGQIVGRNLWGRSIEEALELNRRMVELMRAPQYHRKLTEPRFTGNYS